MGEKRQISSAEEFQIIYSPHLRKPITMMHASVGCPDFLPKSRI